MANDVQEFTAVVIRNLEKNGFPKNAVSFSLDQLYEKASQKGFSFNKVRDELKSKGIESQIDGEKIIFTQTASKSEPFEMGQMASMAQDLLSRMSPQQRDRIMEMAKNMKPEDMNLMKEQWEKMPMDEKMKAMKDLGGKM